MFKKKPREGDSPQSAAPGGKKHFLRRRWPLLVIAGAAVVGVGVWAGQHRARHRDERDARYAGADHGKRHYWPRRTAVSGEKARIVGFASGQVGDGEEDDKIGGEGKQNR